MIPRTFESITAATEWADEAGWEHSRDQPEAFDRRVNHHRVVHELRERRDETGRYWYWGRL